MNGNKYRAKLTAEDKADIRSEMSASPRRHPRMARVLAARYRVTASRIYQVWRAKDEPPRAPDLSPLVLPCKVRAAQVLHAQGWPAADIAGALDLSPRTVEAAASLQASQEPAA